MRMRLAYTTCSLVCRFLILFFTPGELSRGPSLPYNSLEKMKQQLALPISMATLL
jgi:hypothetical protein